MMEYQQHLEQSLFQYEQQQQIPTSILNYRIITGYRNNLQDLGIMFNYIKENKQCNVNLNFNKRKMPDQIIAQFNPVRQFNSSIVLVNKDNVETVKYRCQTNNISYFILKRTHITSLKNKTHEQKLDFFNAYDIFICPHQLIKDLRFQLYNQTQLISVKQEYESITSIIKLLKIRETESSMTNDIFVTMMDKYSKDLEFYKNTNLSPENWGFYGINSRYINQENGYYFQRAIQIEGISSKCSKLIAAKCQYIILYEKINYLWIKELEGAHIQTKHLHRENSQSLNNTVYINTRNIQFKQLIDSMKNQFISNFNQETESFQFYQYYQFNLNNEIPISCKFTEDEYISNIKSLPFKIYNINNETDIPKAVQHFDICNKNTLICNWQRTFKPLQIENVIKTKLTEDCPVCFDSSKERFIFGCCGCNVSIKCLFKLVEFRRIKCPNCRYVITSSNHGFGAFFLDNLYHQIVSNQNQKPSDLANSTIFTNGILTQQKQIDNLDTLTIVYSVPNYLDSLNSLYEYLKNIPENIQINLELYGSNKVLFMPLLKFLDKL